MAYPLARRDAAEAIEQFGDDLAKLIRSFEALCNRIPNDMVDQVNAISAQDQLDTIAEDFRKLGDELCRECDAAEEANDRARANSLSASFRRLA